ncbi:hypothetical protein EI94DRAFT_1703831 [Lactarius quietus]|nr:hypothetical protein EI94DRAFT_1703831 [Lactarius quietus]
MASEHMHATVDHSRSNAKTDKVSWCKTLLRPYPTPSYMLTIPAITTFSLLGIPPVPAVTNSSLTFMTNHIHPKTPPRCQATTATSASTFKFALALITSPSSSIIATSNAESQDVFEGLCNEEEETALSDAKKYAGFHSCLEQTYMLFRQATRMKTKAVASKTDNAIP